MAQLKRQNKTGFLQASTLLETMVASVIIMGCFGVSLMIFEQVMNSSDNASEIRAKLELRNAAINANCESELLIEVEQSGYSNSQALNLVTYSAIDSKGETVSELQILKPKMYE